MYMLCSSLVSRRPSGLVICWLCLQVLLSLLAAVVSVSKPQNRLEATTPLWPPTAPLTRWLERVWLSPWERWDAEYFLKIAERGYRADDGTAQFHPLYPLLGWLIYRAMALADVVWDWLEPRTLVYGLLISRSSAQVVPAQNFIPPWRAVAAAFAHLNVLSPLT